ncbi:MAG: glycosyltransferase family 39 protein [Planctomycetes bacterium]|nr:glycosyltransferase family 39 protein [Planctomycetota bacterium]
MSGNFAAVAVDRGEGSRRFVFLVLVLAGYLAVHLLLRLALSPSLIPDEADLALFSQSLAWGYSEQPPLYSWLVWGAVRLLGLSVFSLTLVRMLVLATVPLMLYAVARGVLRDRHRALLCVSSLFLFPSFAWNAVNYLTHSLLVCAVSLATARSVLLLPHRRGWLAYVALGLWLGVGILSKYNFVLFAAALFLAGLSCRPYRACLLDVRLLLSGAVTALLVLPHLLWAREHAQALWHVLAEKTGVSGSGGVERMLSGISNLLSTSVLLVLPFAAGMALLLRPGAARVFRPDAARPDACRLLERFFLAALLLLTVQVFAGTAHFHDRWLQPFVLLVPVYVFARLEGVGLEPRRVRHYRAVLATMALLLMATQAGRIWLGSRDDGVYPMQMSFAEFEERLSADGLDSATVLTSDRVLGGNLRLRFPDANVFCVRQRSYHPPIEEDDRPVFAVWHCNLGNVYPAEFAAYADRALPRRLEPVGPVRFVTVPPLHRGRTTNSFGYVRLVRR